MYHFIPMTAEAAGTLSSWTYPQPYSLYSMDGSEECIAEFMNGDYFYTEDEAHNLIGFVCGAHSARVPGGYAKGIYNDPDFLDVGLGLHPERTGKGLGSEYLKQALSFLGKRSNKSKFQLVVAAFNERAIKAYAKAGFHPVDIFQSDVSGLQIPFVVMRMPGTPR